jgi:hypothetical protein
MNPESVQYQVADTLKSEANRSHMNSQLFSSSHPNPWAWWSGLGMALLLTIPLKADAQPVIVSPPASQTVYHLQTATFSVMASGAPPLFYQWQHAGTNLAGATATVLVVPTVQPFNGGAYTVVVTNVEGSTTSAPAILTVSGLIPEIISSFEDIAATCGNSAFFEVKAKGPSSTMRLAYQWLFQGVPLNNATYTSLLLTNITPGQAGEYSVVVTNVFGSTNVSAILTVSVEPPQITSPLTAAATQGVPFKYTIQAMHSPASFGAIYLPSGLNLDSASGIISGTPRDSGTFGAVISAVNLCTSASATLILNVASAAPLVRTPAIANGTEGVAFLYQIVASGSQLSFAAQNLPPGLSVDRATGLIAGVPHLGGHYYATVSAANAWGTDQAIVHFNISNAQISGLSIGNVNYSYSSPYLLDFTFSLLDDIDPLLGNGIVADPNLLSVRCLEDEAEISPSETGASLYRTSTKLIKANIVLDFTESIASLSNGDTNRDGISDAVDSMVNGAIAFVNQQSFDTQIGIFEFHRDDMAPSNVVSLTTDKITVDNVISGIWTNNVQGFASGSRCWDALMAAVKGLGKPNRDEEHYVILVSDGRDESSTNSMVDVIAAAAAGKVKVFAIGFGAELNAPPLQGLAGQTQGRYYAAQTPAEIGRQLAQVSKMARSQYVLRWASLKRASKAFMPSFQVAYQGLTADSPTNPFTLGETNIDLTTDPPTTNETESVTNFIIGYFSIVTNASSVLEGSLRLAPNAEVQPTGIDLRASYIPRSIRQLRIHYRPNWPCTAMLQSTGPAELLEGWNLTQTNDNNGGYWLLLSSPDPANITTSLPFASFGKVLTFLFQDPISSSNAFSVWKSTTACTRTRADKVSRSKTPTPS